MHSEREQTDNISAKAHQATPSAFPPATLWLLPWDFYFSDMGSMPLVWIDSSTCDRWGEGIHLLPLLPPLPFAHACHLFFVSCRNVYSLTRNIGHKSLPMSSNQIPKTFRANEY